MGTMMWGGLTTGILGRAWARRVAPLSLFVLAVALFILNLRCQAERASRAAERLNNLERTNAIHRQMLDAASRRPRSRDDLLDRLRRGEF